jgi:hypothetical protein
MTPIIISSPTPLLPHSKYQFLISEGNSHVICPALKKGRVSFELLVESGLFTMEQYFMYCDIVNQKAEVGCFYPKANVSLIPLFREDIGITFEHKQLENYLKDALTANQEYLKCETMIFAFDDDAWNQNVKLFDEIQKASDLFYSTFYNINGDAKRYHLKRIEIHIQ